MIYELYSDSDAPYNMFLVTGKDYDNADKILRNTKGYINRIKSDNPLKKISLKKNWKPFKVELANKAKSRKIPDISLIGTIKIPVFSEKAMNILGDFLNDNGEFLEIICVDDGKTYYAYNVLTFVDIFEQNKTVKLDSSNSRFYFKKDIDFNMLSIFKIIVYGDINYPHFATTTYISQKFLDRVEKYKLKGFMPRTIYYFEESLESYKNTYDYKKFIEFIDNQNKKLHESMERENEQAIKKYLDFLTSHPDNYNCSFNLSVAYARKNDKEKTLEYLKKAILLNEETKEKAKNTYVFKQFFEEPEFKNLLS